MYDLVRKYFHSRVETIGDSLKVSLAQTAGELYLAQLREVSDRFLENLQHVRNILLPLDRFVFSRFQVKALTVSSLLDLGVKLYADRVMFRDQHVTRVVSGVLGLVEARRRSHAVDGELLSRLIMQLQILGVFESKFEEAFNAQSEIFYREDGNVAAQQLKPEQLLHHCKSRMDEEDCWAAQVLPPASRRKLSVIMERAMVLEHSDTLIHQGLRALLREGTNRLDEVRLLHRMVRSVGRVDDLKKAWSGYIREAGAAIVGSDEKASMVEHLLSLKSDMDRVLRECFGSSEAFVMELREAFGRVVNPEASSRPAEMIARYLDAKLRVGAKPQLTEDELGALMDRVIVLFRFISSKDVFETYYKNYLAKRLLLSKSSSLDAERSMLSKLKQECGSEYTAKLEAMFRDLDTSSELMDQFINLPDSAPRGSKIDLRVSVLKMCNWPQYAQIEVNLPDDVAPLQEKFREFYVARHVSRKLTWVHPLGHAVLKAHYPKGAKDLAVSLVQAVVLCAFNRTSKLSLSYKDLLSISGLPESELKRTLLSLATGPVKLLVKRPDGASVDAGDLFYFNKVFQHKSARLRINAVQSEETPEEEEKTKDSIEMLRQFQMDSAIVRIMKTRQTITMANLEAELISCLRFTFDRAVFKKRVDSLIEKEYMERDENDRNTFKYIA